MDFMPDRRTDGHQFRLLDVLQDFNREDLRIKGSLALPAERVVRALNQVNEWRSKLMTVMDDNGPEYISAIRMIWALAQGAASAILCAKDLHALCAVEIS